jgi:hypothetical protein
MPYIVIIRLEINNIKPSSQVCLGLWQQLIYCYHASLLSYIIFHCLAFFFPCQYVPYFQSHNTKDHHFTQALDVVSIPEFAVSVVE